MSKLCQHCNSLNTDESKYCQDCGAPLSQVQQFKSNNNVMRRWINILFCWSDKNISHSRLAKTKLLFWLVLVLSILLSLNAHSGEKLTMMLIFHDIYSGLLPAIIVFVIGFIIHLIFDKILKK